jgi:hypothetical protein
MEASFRIDRSEWGLYAWQCTPPPSIVVKPRLRLIHQLGGEQFSRGDTPLEEPLLRRDLGKQHGHELMRRFSFRESL